MNEKPKYRKGDVIKGEPVKMAGDIMDFIPGKVFHNYLKMMKEAYERYYNKPVELSEIPKN